MSLIMNLYNLVRMSLFLSNQTISNRIVCIDYEAAGIKTLQENCVQRTILWTSTNGVARLAAVATVGASRLLMVPRWYSSVLQR